MRDEEEPWWRTEPAIRPDDPYTDRYDGWDAERGNQRQSESDRYQYGYADPAAGGRHSTDRTGRHGYDPDGWTEPEPVTYTSWPTYRPARRTSREPRGWASSEPSGWSSVEPNGRSPVEPNGRRGGPEPNPPEPDVGSWSRSRGRWVPGQRDTDRPDYTISRYDDTGEMPRSLMRNDSSPVIDQDDWREMTGSQSRVETPDTEDGWSRREWERRVEPTRAPEPVRRPEGTRRASSARRAESRAQERAQARRAEPAHGLEPAQRVEPYRVRSSAPVRRAEPARGRRAIAATAHAAPYTEAYAAPYPAPHPAPPTRDRYTMPIDESDQRRGYLGAGIATVGWYAVPTLLYLVWALLLSGRPRPNCLDALGNPCLSSRNQALHGLVAAMPRIGAALGLAILVAMVVRYVSTGWRGLTVGFSAAIVGAGVTTVLYSVVGR